MKRQFSPQQTKILNAVLIGILSTMVVCFLFWGLGYTNRNDPILFTLAAIAGLFMAFNIGGNDVANSFGTSVGAGTLSVQQALCVAAIFEVSGAVIAGAEVTQTIRSGIVNLDGLPISTREFVCLMSSSLFAAAFWLLFASKRGLPVSTTHAIIGGLVGATLVYGGLTFGSWHGAAQPVRWDTIGTIALSWVISPLLGGALSYLVFRQIKRRVLDYNERVRAELKAIKAERKAFKSESDTLYNNLPEEQRVQEADKMSHDAFIYDEGQCKIEDLKSDYYRGLLRLDRKKEAVDAYRALRNWVPFITAGGGSIIAAMVMFKGLKSLNLDLPFLVKLFVVLMIGVFIWFSTFVYANTAQRKDVNKATFLMFSWMQVFSASSFAFSHGANDIANAIGPFAAVLDALRFNSIGKAAEIDAIVMLAFGLALIIGLWFIGKEVIMTVGKNIARMHPASGFTAELSAASVVMTASVLGLPVSSTHILVGAVLGIGLVNKDANWKLMRPIGLAWVITLPAASMLAGLIFLLMFAVFC